RRGAGGARPRRDARRRSCSAERGLRSGRRRGRGAVRSSARRALSLRDGQDRNGDRRLGRLLPLPRPDLAVRGRRPKPDRVVAEEQALLGRVATLVARGVQPSEVFDAVAEGIGRVLEVENTSVVRYESDATGTVVAIWGDDRLTPIGSNWTLEGESVLAQVF